MKRLFLIFVTTCLFSLTGFANDITPEQLIVEKSFDEDFFKDVPDPQYQTAFWKMILILLAIIALLFITFWSFRRLMRFKNEQANSNKTIKVIEKRALSPKSMLYLVEVEGEIILISESHLEVRRIKENLKL